MVLLEPLDGVVKCQVLSEVGYTEASLREDLLRLKMWLQSQPHLPPSVHLEPDEFFLNFLVGCKGQLNLAKRKLDQYYTVRTTMPDLHAVRDPRDTLHTASTVYFCTMPKPGPDGSRITYLSVREPNPEKYDLLNFVYRCMVLCELRFRSEALYSGEWIVLDGQTFTAAHLLRLSLRVLKDLIQLTQFVYPTRPKGMIFVNAPTFTETFLNTFVKPLLKKKLADRIFVYSGCEKVLLNHFSKELVPRDLGGEAEDFKTLSDMWLKEALAERDLFLGPILETVDEKKRPHDQSSPNELYGSFRKLEID